MARIRSIHPDACENPKLVPLSAEAERTLWRLLTHADDEGRGLDHPKLLAAKLYPLHDDQGADELDAQLWELVEAGMLVRYEVGAKRYFEIHDFTDWQKPKRPTPSKHPSPEDGAEVVPSDRSGEHLTHTSPTPHPEANGHGEHLTPGVEGSGSGEGVEGSTPVGDGKPPFFVRLATKLQDEHGCTFPERDTRYQAFHDLLTEALRRLPSADHRGTTMGLIADFVRETQGLPLTKESRNHTASLVGNYRATDVLYGYGQALDWGAGTTAEYANDPLALSKYVAGVLTRQGSKA